MFCVPDEWQFIYSTGIRFQHSKATELNGVEIPPRPNIGLIFLKQKLVGIEVMLSPYYGEFNVADAMQERFKQPFFDTERYDVLLNKHLIYHGWYSEKVIAIQNNTIVWFLDADYVNW
jgi:hypothetical protein